jgi:hypothetical protein
VDPLAALAVLAGGLPSRESAAELELDLLATLCSEATLCFYCMLPLFVRAQKPEWLAAAAAWASRAGLEVVAAAAWQDGLCQRALGHAACRRVATERRRARGRELVVRLATL